jgi:hypothetical protein
MACAVGFCLITQPSASPIVCFSPNRFEHFFVSYNDARGKKFKPRARKGPAVPQQLIKNQTKKRK